MPDAFAWCFAETASPGAASRLRFDAGVLRMIGSTSAEHAIRRLVEAENRDRETLYREIARANEFGDERIPDIRRIFAETWTAKAEPGWWVRRRDGS